MKEINQEYMVDESNFSTSKYSNKSKGIQVRDLRNLEQIIVHCTAAGTEAWENPLTCIKYDLGANHISRTGLATATYHYYINQKGDKWQLVGMAIKTAHAGMQNTDSIAICINHDGFKSAEITEELYQSLIEVIAHIFDFLDWSYELESVQDRIHFHRDYSPKACPGKLDKGDLQKDVYEYLQNYGDNE